MDTVSWALALKDKVSPIGKKIASTFSKIGGATKKLAEKGLKLAAKGVDKLREKLNDSAPSIAKWAGIAALAAGAGLAYAGVKLAAEAQKFKDSTLIATKALLKSDQLAGTAYKRMLDFANYFGGDPAEAMEKFNHALADGFSARDAEKLLQAFGDLKLVTPNINADGLIDAFGKIRSKGKLALEDFQGAVSAAGLNLTLAYEAIGKKIGKNAKQVEMLIGSGRVRADVGLVGLLDAINQRTNSKQVGERLSEYANTASGLVERLKNLPQQFMLRLTADDSPIKDTLKKLLGQLDPDGPNGKKILAALNSAFTKVSEVLSQWATPEGVDKFAKGLTQFIEAAPKIVKAVGTIAGGVLVVTDAISSFRDNCRFLWAEMKRGSFVALSFASSALSIVAPIVSLSFAIARWVNVVVDGVKVVWAWLSDLVPKALKWGGDIVDGLWNGIKKGWAGFLNKFKALVDLLPDAVKKALGIASPSKVFDREIGRWIMPGLAQGIEATAPVANDAIVGAVGGLQSMAARSVPVINNSANTNSSSSSSSKTVRIDSVTFGDGGSRQEKREQLRDLVSMLERAAI